MASSLAGNGIPAGDKEAKIKMHLKTASSAAAALNLVQNDKGSVDVVEFYTRTEDVLLPYLNSLYGSSIDASDYSIFTEVTEEFHHNSRGVEEMRLDFSKFTHHLPFRRVERRCRDHI